MMQGRAILTLSIGRIPLCIASSPVALLAVMLFLLRAI